MAETSTAYTLLALDIDETGITPLVKPSYFLTLPSSAGSIPHGRNIAGKNYVLYKEQQDIELYLTETYTPNAYNYIIVSPPASSGGTLDSNMKYVYRIDGYDPTGKVEKTADNKPVRRLVIFHCTLDYMATMHFSAGNNGTYTLEARWKRTPIPAVLEPLQIRPAQMMRTLNRTKLPKISSTIVTSTDSLEIVFVKVSAVIYGELTHLSAFCALSNTDGRYASNYLAVSNGSGARYPSLRGIMNYLPTILGVSASDIVDVSVSETCPLKYIFNPGTGEGGRDQMYIDTDVTLTTMYFNFTVSGNTYHCAFERLEGMLLDFKPTTVKVQLSDKERLLGQVALVGSDNSILTTIDTRYADYNSVTQKWEISMSYYCKVELGSMYSELVLKDSSIIRFPEGHLPFVGNSWSEYVNTQRSYDREMAVIEKEKAQVDMVTGIGASLANGAFAAAFSGGAAAGTAAFGIVGNVANWYEGERARENQLQAKDLLMHAAPDTVYSPEYGVGYLNSMLKSDPMRILIVLMPDGVGDTELTAYGQENGYPVTDLYMSIQHSDLPTEGFMQANKLTDLTVGTSGVKTAFLIRGLDKQLRQGIRFRTIT